MNPIQPALCTSDDFMEEVMSTSSDPTELPFQENLESLLDPYSSPLWGEGNKSAPAGRAEGEGKHVGKAA